MSQVTATRRHIGPIEVAALLVIALAVAQPFLAGRLTNPAFEAATTIFVSIVMQALPFLVLGVVLSAAIAAFVPAEFWRKALPRRPALAVPAASCAGAVLPGCECASVPVSGALMAKGVTPAAALAFLLSAPAINPVVMISTWVAFPGQPEMTLARFIASLATAMLMGWIWLRWGKGEWLRIPTRPHVEGASKMQNFAAAASHDILHAGGFLVLGGLAAAIINVFIPPQWLQALADNPVLAILGLAFLAVLLSICSEADAFVAASFSQFSPTAQLAFMVVGPMVDLKLISLQAGTFSRKFATRFAPATFVIAVGMASLVGWWLL